jgi:hypothetical protein
MEIMEGVIFGVVALVALVITRPPLTESWTSLLLPIPLYHITILALMEGRPQEETWPRCMYVYVLTCSP